MRVEWVEVRSIPVNHLGSWMLVRVGTGDGLVGIGEASQSGDDEMVVELIGTASADVLMGATADDPLALKGGLYEAIKPVDGDLPRQTAYSALEVSLWDLRGKLERKPLHRLLGEQPSLERIRLYANINRATRDRTADGMATVARSAVAAGFAALKCAPFDELSPDQSPSEALSALNRGVARVVAIREAVGDDIEVMVDCRRRCDISWVVEVAHSLTKLGVSWLEDPLPSHQENQLTEVAEAVDQRVALGEHFYDWAAFSRYSDLGDSVVFMPDVKHAGGIEGLWEITQNAIKGRVPLSFHNPSGPVATAASLHVAAHVPDGLPVEYAWGEIPNRSSVIQPEETLHDGSLPVPNAPGLGIQANEDWLAYHSHVVLHQRIKESARRLRRGAPDRDGREPAR